MIFQIAFFLLKTLYLYFFDTLMRKINFGSNDVTLSMYQHRFHQLLSQINAISAYSQVQAKAHLFLLKIYQGTMTGYL